MSHILFPGKTTLWIDGSIQLKSLPPERELGAFAHKSNVKSIAAEITECAAARKFGPGEEATARIRLEQWKAEGFTDGSFHPETGVLMRQDTDRIRVLNELWWRLIQEVKRDQTSCEYAAWKAGLSWDPLPGSVVANNFCTYDRHVPSVAQANHVPIYYFTPYDKRGIGVAYNECCKIVPDGAWACLMDADIMLFPADFGDIIQETIAKRPDIDIWTTMVTRVGCSRAQVCPGGRPDEERDLVTLREKAVAWSKGHRGAVKEMPSLLAGYFLLFRKSLWDQMPFPETAVTPRRGGARISTVLGIDTQWSNTCRAAGKRFAIIEGLLAIHYYTLGVSRKDHLRLLEPRPMPYSVAAPIFPGRPQRRKIARRL